MSTTQTLVKGIEQSIFNKSSKLSVKVFNRSEVLTDDYDTDTFVSSLYSKRRSFISDLVGTTGRYSFTPKSKYDATEEATSLINKELEEIKRKYNLTPLNSDDGADLEDKYNVLSFLRNYLKNEDYLANSVPSNLINHSKDYTKGKKVFMTSPKLSRWITRLVGESAELTKWYTNRCPKGENVVGERTDFKMVLSVLPHDIAGMSYYAPLNFSGERWIDGYHGTSCMDTVRNGEGSSMHQLPSNLYDETMMVAYLAKVDESKPRGLDDLEDIFHARMLVRVTEINGKHILIGQRIYATTRGTQKLITEAMKVEFGDSYIHCNELEDMGGSSKTFKYTYEEQKEVNSIESCPSCDGSGLDGWDDDCGRCEGEGEISKFELPYNDNPSVITFGQGHIKFTLPTSFVESLS